MGYCMEQDGFATFVIKKENFDKALEAIKNLKGKETCKGSSGPHFSWVTTKQFMEAKTLEQALKAWRWDPNFDDDGNITSIEFAGEKLGDEEHLFIALAPFVEDEGIIPMIGEDRSQWRWRFLGGNVYEDEAIISYEMSFTPLGRSVR